MQRTATSIRRTVAVAGTAIALLTMTMQPAWAEGYLSNSRPFSIEGTARTKIATTMKVVDTSPFSSTTFSMGLGPADTITAPALALVQDEAGEANRSLRLDAYGYFTNVSGTNCTYEPFGDDFGIMGCKRAGFDWVEGQGYRVAMERGGTNADNMTLWTVTIKKAGTNNVTEIVSFRSQYAKLSTSYNGASISMNAANCENINPLKATFTKPVVNEERSKVDWESAHKFEEGCDATMPSTTDAGTVTMAIR